MSSEFPKRPDAHVSENVSVRIFQDCLPAKWIFRDQGSRNDYGIDGEVELVSADGELRGDIAKVQLKGQSQVEFNAEGIAAVGGIRQATLRYWISLCRYANVFACLTDNASRETYFTPVFWEATARLDGSNETRSIHFTRAWSLRDVDGPALFTIAARHRPPEVVSAHKAILRGLAQTFHDFLWMVQADPWTIHRPLDIVQNWLTAGRSILPWVSSENEDLFDLGYWRRESDKHWGDGPMRGTLAWAYAKTFPLVLPEVHRLSTQVKRGSYYWSREDLDYLLLVEATRLPEQYEWEAIEKFVHDNRIEDPR
jgi:hypothetical protein